MAKHPHEPDTGNDERRVDTKSAPQSDRAAADKQAAEGRASMHEREQKRRDDEFKQNEARITAEGEAAAEKTKEAERRAKLSPEEQAAEVSPFAATVPHFPTLAEPHHSAEFILSEANGQRSRGAAYFADPTTVYVGMPVKQTAPATATQPATYVPAAVGADCSALCIYAGGTIPGEGLRTAVIVRDAEVNKNLISWGAITAPEQVIGLTTLAAAGIIAR
jgi:hypothetical protein